MMEFANKLAERVGKGYLSYSSCKEALKDIKLWEMYMQGRLRKDSDALRFGSIYDKLLFEPQLFSDEFVLMKGDGYISDSKTTQRMSGFKYDVFKFGYDIQAYIYCRVFDVDEYYWVVQEKAFPYAVGVYKASPQTLESGERKFNTAVEKIREYLDGNLISDAYYNYQEI